MKHIIVSVLSVVFFSILFTSCSQNDNGLVIKRTMSANINGASWQTTDVTVTKQIAAATELRITGVDATGKNITLGLFDYLGETGLYSINGSSNFAWYGTSPTNLTQAAYGQINVTNISNGYIYGNFDFTTTDSTRIIMGAFTAPLPNK